MTTELKTPEIQLPICIKQRVQESKLDLHPFSKILLDDKHIKSAHFFLFENRIQINIFIVPYQSENTSKPIQTLNGYIGAYVSYKQIQTTKVADSANIFPPNSVFYRPTLPNGLLCINFRAHEYQKVYNISIKNLQKSVYGTEKLFRTTQLSAYCKQETKKIQHSYLTVSVQLIYPRIKTFKKNKKNHWNPFMATS